MTTENELTELLEKEAAELMELMPTYDTELSPEVIESKISIVSELIKGGTLSLNGTCLACIVLATLYATFEKYPEAIATLQIGLTCAASNEAIAMTWLTLAACYTNLHQFDQATEVCKNAMAVDAENKERYLTEYLAILMKNANPEEQRNQLEQLGLSPPAAELENGYVVVERAQEEGVSR